MHKFVKRELDRSSLGKKEEKNEKVSKISIDAEEPENVEENATEDGTGKPAEKNKGGSIVPWIIVAAVVIVAAGAGIGLGLMFGGKGNPKVLPATPTNQSPEAQRPAACTESV